MMNDEEIQRYLSGEFYRELAMALYGEIAQPDNEESSNQSADMLVQDLYSWGCVLRSKVTGKVVSVWDYSTTFVPGRDSGYPY